MAAENRGHLPELPARQHLGPIEIRSLPHEAEGYQLDEVVGTVWLHIERMSDGGVWIGVFDPAYEHGLHVNLVAEKKGRLRMTWYPNCNIRKCEHDQLPH